MFSRIGDDNFQLVESRWCELGGLGDILFGKKHSKCERICKMIPSDFIENERIFYTKNSTFIFSRSRSAIGVNT